MKFTHKPAIIAAAALLGLGTLSGCAYNAEAKPHHQPMSASASMTSSATKAADLRVALNKLLGEHVILAADATGAALGGRSAEFEAAAAALDGNSQDIAAAVGSVYGAPAGEAFLPLWRKHIGFVVDYTQGVAKKDKAAQDKAVNALLGYANDFGAFINSASPALPKEAVAELVKTHAVTLKNVIDAQAAGDQKKAYTTLRTAYAHMSHISDALSEAIVQQFPQRF
jgi:hypothetical protein